jgi:O-antigen ligase
MVEYALLAPSVVLLFRRAVDLDRFLTVFVVWAAAAGVWGLLQFLGVVNEFEGRRTGQREVSFLGHQDLGGFTGAALAVGFAALVLGERKRLGWIALVGGALGVAIDASVFAFLGTVLAAGAALLVGRRVGTLTLRRFLAVGAILVVVGSGVYGLRGSDVSNYFSFLGLSKATQTDNGVQTGSQRTMLLWIGWRMWVDHPILGVGFERSATDFPPYLPAVKKKFPGQSAQSYPSKQNPWGVQNFWVQLLADTGIVGFFLGLATFATGIVTALRAVPRRAFVATVGASWILVAAGTWNAIGIIAGIPLDAVTWLGLGLGVVAWEIA